MTPRHQRFPMFKMLASMVTLDLRPKGILLTYIKCPIGLNTIHLPFLVVLQRVSQKYAQ